MEAGIDPGRFAREMDEGIRQVHETVEGATEEQISETERRLREMAEAQDRSGGAASAFAQAIAGDAEEKAPRMSAAERARLRKQRKRERQGRRRGRR